MNGRLHRKLPPSPPSTGEMKKGMGKKGGMGQKEERGQDKGKMEDKRLK